MEVYLVGGAVRDRLLGLEVKDRDWVVVGATPEEMLKRGFTPVGKDFPVFLHPHSKEEYALARTERKTAPGYRGFAIDASPAVTLEEDLQRRDLTINAMAETASGQLIDPYHGQQDLDNGILRHVSPAFAEDPVRILRVARFAARYAKWGFRVAHGTNKLMRQMVDDGEVDALVAERVWSELERALGEDTPSRFFSVLRGCGALSRLFPEVDDLFGVPQPETPHPEVDTGVHVMLVVDMAARITPDTRVRFAALLHDVGKAGTPEHEWPRHLQHETRGVKMIEELCRRFRVPNDYRDLAMLVSRYHSHCHRADELTASTLLKTLEALDAFRKPERIKQFVLACEADARGRAGHDADDYPQGQRFLLAFDAARRADIRPATRSGLQGEAMGNEIHRLRIHAIKRALGPDRAGSSGNN
jgi:tRNA nucleotidyltransferase (CCA-adding enzyme)